MKRRDVLNVSEGRVLDQLERSLAGEGYSIFAGLPLKRVIEGDSDDALTYEEKQMLLHGELDFAIVSRSDGNTIVFGIEFDGPYHEDPERQAKDRIKDGLCLRAGVPLIRIRPEAIEPKEQITLLEWILDGYLFYRRERKGKIQDLIDYWTDNWRNRDSDFPPGDAAVALHTIVPFPASETIRARLRTRYEIWTQPTIGFPWEQEQGDTRKGLDRFFDELSAYNEAPLKLIDLHRLHTLFPDEDDEDKGEQEVPHDFRLAVVRESEPIYVAEAPIDWSPQPILTQAPAAGRIGTWMWAVDVALAEYRALREIERWADRTLVRVDGPA